MIDAANISLDTEEAPSQLLQGEEVSSVRACLVDRDRIARVPYYRLGRVKFAANFELKSSDVS